MVSRVPWRKGVEAKFWLPSELLTPGVLILEAQREGLCCLHEGTECPICGTCLLSRISGNAASDKNIKDGVCAQIEKNFARAKWKVGFGSLSSWPNSKCFFLHPQFLAAAAPLQLNTNFSQAIICGF